MTQIVILFLDSPLDELFKKFFYMLSHALSTSIFLPRLHFHRPFGIVFWTSRITPKNKEPKVKYKVTHQKNVSRY
jgi:hypothetical protein